ncbi:MAG: hypothetical protein NTW28_04270, partial [Candidatus Solibacter sp.]|nr:hypothetical protein [Candidatus Solibacter sp.]
MERNTHEEGHIRHLRFLFPALFLAATGVVSAANLEGRIVEDHTGNPLASVEVRIYKTGQR